MALEINIFNIFKQLNSDSDEVLDVNSFEGIREAGNLISLCISNLLEVALIMDDNFLQRLNLHDVAQLIKCMNYAHCSHIARWIPKREAYEELPPPTMKLIPSILNLQHLSSNIFPRIQVFIFGT